MIDLVKFARDKLAERKSQLEYINSGTAIAGWTNADGDLVMLLPGDENYHEAIGEYRIKVEREIASFEKWLAKNEVNQ